MGGSGGRGGVGQARGTPVPRPSSAAAIGAEGEGHRRLDAAIRQAEEGMIDTQVFPYFGGKARVAEEVIWFSPACERSTQTGLWGAP